MGAAVGREPLSLFVSDDTLALATDLYQLTMAAGYHRERLEMEAAFELFVRRLPPTRGFLLAAGLEQALHYLSHLRFDERSIEYLRGLDTFAQVRPEFFDYLRRFRFTGSVRAIPEGTVVFAEEPLLQVTAPIIEAQIVETWLISTMTYQTVVATKAARIVGAAAGRRVVDFGSRRAPGPQAGVLAARAAFIGGCEGTSNVLAARELGIPPVGTAAHSWTMVHASEEEAFRRYCETFPGNAILLIDTYDTLVGAQRAARFGNLIKGVRLDSGDLVALACRVREILDAAGLQHVRIVASGDLNEHKLADITRRNAPVDAFGVGTEMVTSRDEPALPCVYKLVQTREGDTVTPRFKLSPDKASYPYAKQVLRSGGDRFSGDVIDIADSDLDGEPLLVEVMEEGRLCRELPDIQDIQARAREQVASLPEGVRRIENPDAYRVRYSQRLERVKDELYRAHRGNGSGETRR